MIRAISLALFLAHLAVHTVSAEMIRFGAALTNALNVASNEAVLIQGIFSQDGNPLRMTFTHFLGPLETQHELLLRSDSGGFETFGERPPRVLAGPARLQSDDPAIFVFRRLDQSPAQSYVMTTNSVLSIEVPAGKSLTLYIPLLGASSDGHENLFEIKEFEELSAPQFLLGAAPSFRPGRAYSGPFRAYFKSRGSTNLLTVIVSDDVVQQPDAGALSAGFGQKILTIEESSDLQNWRPSVQTIVGGEDKSFYRFRIDQ